MEEAKLFGRHMIMTSEDMNEIAGGLETTPMGNLIDGENAFEQ